MKKFAIPKFVLIISGLLALGFIVSLISDFMKYSETDYKSFGFYVFYRFLEFIVPAIIFLLVGFLTKGNKKNIRTVIISVTIILVLFLIPSYVKWRMTSKSFGEKYSLDVIVRTIVYETDNDLSISDYRNKWKEKTTKYGGISCTECYYPGSKETGYDYMTFYVFDSRREAQKAFEDMRDNEKMEIVEIGTDYYEGWLENVLDAYIKEVKVLSRNMIICADTLCVSAEDGSAVDRGYVKDLIFTTFVDRTE